MKNKIEIILIMLLFIGFGFFTVINTETISYEERRYLAKFPDIKSKTFFDDLDKYFSDHFIFRNEFRKNKALFNNNILMMSDMNNIFIEDAYIFEIDDRINQKSIDNLANVINMISKDFEDQEKYMMLIPRKNDYLNPKHVLDYQYNDLYKKMSEALDIECISLYDDLSLDSYYRTDIHFRQDKLDKVVDHIFDTLNYQKIDVTYKANIFSPFYGALYAKAANDIEADELVYLTSDSLKDVKVYDLEKNQEVVLYDINELGGIDSYNVYVDGPSAYLEISNPNVTNGQNLIIFRDSYASSIIPLLASSFEKIQVVDLRYYSRKYLDQLDLSKDAKVLFIYGSEVVNNSFSIK